MGETGSPTGGTPLQRRLSRSDTAPDATPTRIGWTILSNHGHVAVSIASEPELTLREIADRVGITERAVFGIVTDLERAGYLTRRREGRKSRYELHPEVPLRHPLENRHTLGDLLAAVTGISEFATTQPASGHGTGRTARKDSATADQAAQ